MVERTSPNSARLLGTHAARDRMGKTSAFFGPILVLRHFVKILDPISTYQGRKPLALVVRPLIELGNAHEDDLKAICVTAESLQAASKEGRSLLQGIRRCEWSVVLLSAACLVSREVDAILRDSTFRANLGYCQSFTRPLASWPLHIIQRLEEKRQHYPSNISRCIEDHCHFSCQPDLCVEWNLALLVLNFGEWGL